MAQGVIIVSYGLNRGNRHIAFVSSDGCDINDVIVCMRTDETDIDNSIGVIDLHDHAVVAPCNVEYYPVSCHDPNMGAIAHWNGVMPIHRRGRDKWVDGWKAVG